MPYSHPAIREMIGSMGFGMGSSLSNPSPKATGASVSIGGTKIPFQSAKPTPTEQKLDRLIQLLEASSNSDGGGINAPININGVKDPDRAARKAIRELERRINRRR